MRTRNHRITTRVDWPGRTQANHPVPFEAQGGGTTATFSFDYSSAVVAPPTSSQIRFNALHPYTAVTTLWIRPVTTDGADVQTFLLLIPTGSTVYVQDRNDHTLFARFTTTAATVDQTTYVEVPVAWVANGGALLNNQAVDVLVVTGGGGGGGGGAPDPHATTHEAGGSDPLTALSASILTSGTVPDARFPATLPVVSGVNLTALNATQLTSGTLPDARLSGNVARRDEANTFTGDQTINASVPRLWFFESAQPVDQRLFQLVGYNRELQVHAHTDAAIGVTTPLRLDRLGNAYIWQDLYEKQRTTPLGHWIDVPFNTANFFAGSGGGTWTVGAAAVHNNRYTLIGKTLHWSFYVSWFSGSNALVGTVTQLRITMPGGYSAVASQFTGIYGQDGGARVAIDVIAVGTRVDITKQNGTAFSAGAVGLIGTVTCEIA